MQLPESEKFLIQQAIQQDNSAFVRLYDLYVGKVYRHVYYRLGNRADTEDITQEVFLRAWKAISRYKWTGAPFLSWLTTIAHNLIADYYKRKARNKITSIEEREEELQYQTLNNGNAIYTEGEIDAVSLEEAISRLKGDKQRVIVMRFIDGFSYPEIARALNKREGAIRVIQYRALRELRDILSADGFQP